MGAELTAAIEKLAQRMTAKAAEGLPPASGAIAERQSMSSCPMMSS